MRTTRLAVFLVVAVTIIPLMAEFPRGYYLPYLPFGRAITQRPCPVPLSGGGCSDYWVPAGPAMDGWKGTVFQSGLSEFNDIQSGLPHIDMTDYPLTPTLVGPFTTSSNFQVSSQAPKGLDEIEFMLATNFWGVNMTFGNDPKGVNIRQGIAHMIDRAAFAAKEPSISGRLPL